MLVITVFQNQTDKRSRGDLGLPRRRSQCHHLYWCCPGREHNSFLRKPTLMLQGGAPDAHPLSSRKQGRRFYPHRGGEGAAVFLAAECFCTHLSHMGTCERLGRNLLIYTQRDRWRMKARECYCGTEMSSLIRKSAP